MTQDLSVFDKYRADVLFLLVGGNPLPNYVSARLLTRPRATVYLLATTATDELGKRLARRLSQDRADLAFIHFTVSEADGPAIASKMGETARKLALSQPNASIGLNLTGGTKPMAVYSALALRQTFPRAIFSYLDARTLSMIVDAGGPVQAIPVGRAVTLTLDDLAHLHGYRITQRIDAPRHQPIAEAIRDVHLAPGGLVQWRAWLESWRNDVRLPTPDDGAALQAAIGAFDAACGGQATETGVARALGFERLEQCGKYFTGGWLEDCTLAAVMRVKSQVGLDAQGAELLIRSQGHPDFDLDVAATLGYQLFGLSCVVTKEKGRAKEHLFEIFTRAGQLGGDEARFAVVSFYDKPEELERDVSQAWDAQGKIKVFGRSHIQNLSDHLLKWFKEANREVT